MGGAGAGKHPSGRPCLLLGQSINRPDCGAGGSLAYRQTLLKHVVFPFDPGLVKLM